MEKFFADHWELAGVIFSLVFGWVTKIAWNKFNKIDEIEKNYLDRFSDIKDDNHEKHNEVMEGINNLGLKVVAIEERVESQQNICRLIQEQKKIGH